MLDKENILYRVFSKIIIIDIAGSEYIVKAPSAILRYKAEIYKQKMIEQYKYDLPRLEFYDQYLVARQFIDIDHEKKIKDMSNTIRRFKVELFQCGPLIEREKQIRKNLGMMKTKLNIYIGNMEGHRRPTIEYFAESLKNKYILINTIFDGGDNLVFNQKDLDIGLLNKVIEKVNEYDISGDQMREVAHTTPWVEYWRANKTNVFGIPAQEYSEEQKLLSSFSRMYDSVFESSDCPSDDIINDHDKLDGFLIFQSEKNKGDKQEEFTSIPERFEEVYITAGSQQEADSIYSANTAESKRIMRQRSQILKNKEVATDLDFPDKKMDLLAQMSEQESQLMKRR